MSMSGMPKVELHLHPEGGALPGFIRRLAQQKNLAGTFGREYEDVRAISITAAKAAFCDETTRARVMSQLEPADA